MIILFTQWVPAQNQENRVVKSGTHASSVRSLEPCVRYSVRIDSRDAYGSLDVMIGFAPKAGFNSTYNMGNWHMCGYNGKLDSQDGVNQRSYCSKTIGVGSVVTCMMNRPTSSISYDFDGQSCGVAFTKIPQGEVYAALCWTEFKASIRNLRNQRSQHLQLASII